MFIVPFNSRLRYTKYAKETFLSLLENAKNLEMEDRKVMQTKWKEREVKSVRYMNLTKIVAIIRLALILAKEDIHLADIFRLDSFYNRALICTYKTSYNTVSPFWQKCMRK